jgi:hypothetical protein
MGPPYTYEQVLADCKKYGQVNSDAQFSAWWQNYLWDSGFPNDYYSLSELNRFVSGGKIVGILALAPTIDGQLGHVVAIDECGFINPATKWPDRIHGLTELLREYRRLGVRYQPEDDFLAVWLP